LSFIKGLIPALPQISRKYFLDKKSERWHSNSYEGYTQFVYFYHILTVDWSRERKRNIITD
jgi:hypothetical protein